jgi:hypothetical protein
LVRLHGFAPSSCSLVVDVAVTSARTNTNVPRIVAHLPLPDSLALGSWHGKLDADLRTSVLLGTPSVQSICHILANLAMCKYLTLSISSKWYLYLSDIHGLFYCHHGSTIVSPYFPWTIHSY